ncbi:MAG: 50S ribosomal protein L13 [Elusimicrobiota bacterium]|jgi:large subunit ribosomal protein L13|nr:50S ribosomal protein L13 [Elusimicrobiota bacterium]
MKKTFVAKKENIEKKWYVVDAKDIVLGRLATRVANVLRGKHKPIFTPHVDTGDNVVIINAKDIKLTGKKLVQKMNFRYSGYPGGATFTRYDVLMETKPERAVYLAVRGMLPKNKMRDVIIKKLHIYKGSEHLQAAQKPEKLDILNMK